MKATDWFAISHPLGTKLITRNSGKLPLPQRSDRLWSISGDWICQRLSRRSGWAYGRNRKDSSVDIFVVIIVQSGRKTLSLLRLQLTWTDSQIAPCPWSVDDDQLFDLLLELRIEFFSLCFYFILFWWFNNSQNIYYGSLFSRFHLSTLRFRTLLSYTYHDGLKRNSTQFRLISFKM